MVGIAALLLSAPPPDLMFALAKRVQRPPRIDGRIEPGEWPPFVKEPFWDIFATPDRPAREGTSFSICYDDKALYIAAICEEPKPEGLVKLVTWHDGPVYQDDSIEVFLDTNHDHKTYFHFVANCIGTRFEEFVTDKSWDANWLAAASIGRKEWTLEMAIPFSALKARPKEGDVWGFNICREHWAHGVKEISAWSLTRGGFHNPKAFGHLIFGTARPVMRRAAEEALREAASFERRAADELRQLRGSREAEEFLAALSKVRGIASRWRELPPDDPKALSNLLRELSQARKGLEEAFWALKFAALFAEG